MYAWATAARIVAKRQRRTSHETFVNGRRRAGGSGARASIGARAGHEPVHRGGDRQHGRHPARRHRRGVESGAHRGESCRIHRRHGALPAGRSASRHLHHHVHAARFLDRAGRAAGAAGRVLGHGRRGALGRRSRGDGDRLGRSAGGRRAVDQPGRGARPRGARRHSDRPQPAVDGAVDSGRQDEPSGGRPDDRRAADLHVGPRHEQPADHGHRRRAARHELRGRRGGAELQQPARGVGDGLRDERHLGRDPDRRRAHQHDPERGREHAQRAELLRVHREYPPGRQPSPAAEGSRSDLDRVGRLRVRPERRPRRAAHPRQAVVLRQRTPFQHQRAGDRQLLQERDGDGAPLHADRKVPRRHRGAPAGHQRRPHHQRAAAPDLADEPEQQVLGLSRPDHQAAVPRLRRARGRRHRVAPPRLADLLRGRGQVDLDHQQPAPAGSGLLDQRRELEQRRPGGRRAERAGPRAAGRRRRSAHPALRHELAVLRGDALLSGGGTAIRASAAQR